MSTANQSKPTNKQAAMSKTPSNKWAKLFKSISKPSTSFKLKKWEEEDRGICQDDLRNLGICLVSFILGRFPGWKAIGHVKKSWAVDSSCTMHESGWMIFWFNSEEDRDLVMQKGPYETLGAPWVLKKLPTFFNFKEDTFNTVPTWVRLYGLPLELWTENDLGKIVSFIGEPLAADEGTVQMTKTTFARLLVEVDVTKPLIREVLFTLPDGTTYAQAVTYEREPKWCALCKMMSHNQKECRRRKADTNDQPLQPVQESAAASEQGKLQTPPQSTQMAPQICSGEPQGTSTKEVMQATDTTPISKGDQQLTNPDQSTSGEQMSKGKDKAMEDVLGNESPMLRVLEKGETSAPNTLAECVRSASPAQPSAEPTELQQHQVPVTSRKQNKKGKARGGKGKGSVPASSP